MRVTLVAVICSTAFYVLPVCAQASIQHYQLNIPRQPLDTALKEFAYQTGLQVARFSDSVDGSALVGPVNGDMSAEDALKSLIGHSGLKYQIVNDKTIAIVSPRAQPAAIANVTDVQTQTETREHPQEAGKNSSQDFRLAQVDASPAPSQLSAAQKSELSERPELDEVIVTAQKRAERLVDTPQSVSVVSSEELGKLGATQLRDYASLVPGLSLTTDGAGFSQVTLRGVTTGNLPVSPTVAIYVDDVPVGSTSAFGFGGRFGLDLGLFDLDRIEVLRGPQGTLYGASTMGGLIKYVGVSPDTTAVNGLVQSGVANTQSGGVSYTGAGALNIPLLADSAAMRVSAYYSHDGGFIDNLALNKNDVDRAGIYGGRGDFLWKPTDELSIRAGGLIQDIARDGHATADYTYLGAPVYGMLDQYRYLAEPLTQHFRLGDLSARYNFGFVTLSSISAYQTMRTDQTYDYTAAYNPFFGGAYSAIGLPDSTHTNKFTQEIRLETNAPGRFQWLLGGFYTHEKSEDQESFTLRGPTGLPVPNDLFIYATPSTYEEYAAFANLTYKITSQIDITGGVRYSRDKQTYSESQSGAFGDVQISGDSNEGVATYLGDLRYHLTKDSTAYARFATGYRPGGPNFVADNPATGQPYAPSTFQADSLKSYEVGYKAETEDRRFTVDVDTYYIDWRNVQILTSRGTFAVILNAPGGATVRGAELSVTARPIDGLSMSAALAYQDPRITKANADLAALAGERLPNVPHFSGSYSVDYQLPLSSFKPSLGATIAYVSDRATSFGSVAGGGTVPQFFLPSYANLDVRNSYQIASADLQFYVRNILDRRGELSATGDGSFAEVSMLQPRTYGLRISKRF